MNLTQLLTYCNTTQGHNPNFSVRKALSVAQDMFDLKKRGATMKQASHSTLRCF
jgi:hypothetical protein